MLMDLMGRNVQVYVVADASLYRNQYNHAMAMHNVAGCQSADRNDGIYII
jgi:isochorismate hydrolase